MGVASTCFLSFLRPSDTLEFLEHMNRLGAAGIQAPLKSLDPSYTRAVRKRAAELGMYVEVMAPLPRDDAGEFEKHVLAAKEAGAECLRSACLSGRRYETFASYEEWKQWSEKARDSVLRAVSVVEKHKLPLALENHKDWTSDELARMARQISSEYVGVCLDTGNNLALLEDPMTVVETLAPFAVSTHLKDMAMREIPEGFELSEVVLGEGQLDIARIVATIQAARPRTRLTLEMITRDPLKVPCLTTKYWATFPDRSGYVLAKAMERARAYEKPLPRVSGLDRPAQLTLEEENVKRCLAKK